MFTHRSETMFLDGKEAVRFVFVLKSHSTVVLVPLNYVRSPAPVSSCIMRGKLKYFILMNYLTDDVIIPSTINLITALFCYGRIEN